MKEIGGYLELENLFKNEYHKNSVALNSARNALVYLVRAKNISKVYIPYYLCDSVYKVLERENISYEFYHTDKNFMPLFDKTLEKNEFLYIVNYYGQISKAVIKKLKKIYKRIIVDNVQAFFSKPVRGVDTIYSCRKFFGVPDGAYLVTDLKGLSLEIDMSNTRMKHILGRFDEENASKYYSDFQDNDSLFEELPLMNMSRITKNLLGAVDYKKVKKIRNTNFKTLHRSLKDKNKLDISFNDGAYMYAFYSENAEAVRKQLADKKIYIPVLWPNVNDMEASLTEKDYARNILPLPIDQRYTKKDMEFLIKILSEII